MSSQVTLSDLIVSSLQPLDNLDGILNLSLKNNDNEIENNNDNEIENNNNNEIENNNDNEIENNNKNQTNNADPNFVTAKGKTIFSNYSQSPSGTLTNAQTNTLVKGGIIVAIAEAQANFFNNDPTFSSLFTNTSIVGSDGQFTGKSDSETKVIASFTVGAHQSFSFDFSADLALTAKEIENRDVEYNKAQSKTAFLVLDTTNPNKAKVLDYFGVQGNLISSDKIADLTFGRSRNVTINNRKKSFEIDGNNGSDFLNGSAVGTYQRNFTRKTNITVVEINTSGVELAGDTLIGNLGEDVIYGTIWNDNLTGTNGADTIYASLGDDSLYGKKGNDVLHGSNGNDVLDGGNGNDTLYGGNGNDVLIGSSDNDLLVGGGGNDTFIFKGDDTSLKSSFDVIQDFQIGIDKIGLEDWGSLGNITDTKFGAILTLDSSLNQQTILISGVSASQINSQSIWFT